MKFLLAFVIIFATGTSQAQFRTQHPLQAAYELQAPQPAPANRVMPSDSSSPAQMVPSSRVYNVNPWVSGAITVAGGAISLLALNTIRFKPEISDAEFNALRPDLINSFDRWAINVQTTNVPLFETYSNITQGFCAIAPLSLLFMNRVKDDWGHVLLMYAEATSVTISLYVASPMGPQFQNKFRPSVYDESASRDSRRDGNHRNSFYSGHVATASVGTFFFAKVYTDYHPELGNDKYWFYALALAPPLVMGYCRIKAHDHFPSDVLTGLSIGALCGILIPELHRITCNNLSFGAYAPPGGGGGLTFQWVPTNSSIAQK